MNSNNPKVSRSVVTGPVNPVGGPVKRKTEQGEGGGDGKRLAMGTGEMVTDPVPLGPGPTGQVVRSQDFGKAKAPKVAAKNEVASSSQVRNRSNIAVKMVSEPVSSKSEVLIPAGMKTVDKMGLCYYVLQKGTDYDCILKQIYKIDSSALSEAGFCSKLVAVKRRELSWGPERLLRDLILPFCRGNPGVHGVFNELDRRNVWLHGPSGMGKEAWLRKEFPPEQGYLYIYSRQDLKQFKPREHKGIVAVNLKMCPVLWPAEILRQLVGLDLDRTFYFGRKKIEIPQWTQRIVTSEQAPSEMFGVYEKYLKRNMSGTGYFKGMMWRTIAVHVTRPIHSLIPSA